MRATAAGVDFGSHAEQTICVFILLYIITYYYSSGRRQNWKLMKRRTYPSLHFTPLALAKSSDWHRSSTRHCSLHWKHRERQPPYRWEPQTPPAAISTLTNTPRLLKIKGKRHSTSSPANETPPSLPGRTRSHRTSTPATLVRPEDQD